jgi:hypothetical protein
MPSWIAILGGLLLMMGQHDRSESLFYYFRIEDQVPENHLLRLVLKNSVIRLLFSLLGSLLRFVFVGVDVS